MPHTHFLSLAEWTISNVFDVLLLWIAFSDKIKSLFEYAEVVLLPPLGPTSSPLGPTEGLKRCEPSGVPFENRWGYTVHAYLCT